MRAAPVAKGPVAGFISHRTEPVITRPYHAMVLRERLIVYPCRKWEEGGPVQDVVTDHKGYHRRWWSPYDIRRKYEHSSYSAIDFMHIYGFEKKDSKQVGACYVSDHGGGTYDLCLRCR